MVAPCPLGKFHPFIHLYVQLYIYRPHSEPLQHKGKYLLLLKVLFVALEARRGSDEALEISSCVHVVKQAPHDLLQCARALRLLLFGRRRSRPLSQYKQRAISLSPSLIPRGVGFL